MNKTISILRLASLFILFGLAAVLLFGEEQNDNLAFFFLHLVMNKGMALALFFCVGVLYKRWSKIDPWIKAYNKMTNDL